MIEEFKRGMNGGIRRKLMEAENQPASIEQWCKRAMALNRNWRESNREKKSRVWRRKNQGDSGLFKQFKRGGGRI